MNAIFTHNLAVSLTCFLLHDTLAWWFAHCKQHILLHEHSNSFGSKQPKPNPNFNKHRQMLPKRPPDPTYYQQQHTSKIAMASSSSSRPPCIGGGFLLCLHQHSPETEQKWPKCRRVFRSLLGFLCKTRDFCNPHNNFFFPAADYGSHKQTTNNQSIAHTHEQPGLRNENPNSHNSADTLCMPCTVLIIVVRVSKDVSSSVHTVCVSCSVKMAGLNI
jgi:hypothetical protein